MADKYQDLAHNPIGKFLVKQLGLPNPPYLERYQGGPLVNSRGEVIDQRVNGDVLELSVRLSAENWARFQATESA